MAAPALTPRQVEVVRLAGEGLTTQETARRLGLRPKTVTAHLDAAYRRLGVRNKTAASVALWRIDHGEAA